VSIALPAREPAQCDICKTGSVRTSRRKMCDAFGKYVYSLAVHVAIVGPANQNGCITLRVGNLADEKI
jgi:hypothetical protein